MPNITTSLWKGIQLGYDEILIDPASTRECSYCLRDNEVEAILGMLEPLSWITRWESKSSLSIDRNLVDAFASNLRRKLMSGCCGEIPLTRFNGNGVFQESFDNGTTWVDSPQDDPRNSTIIFPPIPGSDGNDKKCSCSNSLVTYFKNVEANIQTAKDSEATAADISAILVGILLVLGIISGGWLFAFLGELVGLIYANVTAEQWTAAFTDETWADLLCFFYCNMENDGSFTNAEWSTVISEIESSGFDPIAVEFFVDMLKSMREMGMTNAARSNLGGTLSCNGCCQDCDSDNWTFYSNGGIDAGVTLVRGPGYIQGTTYHDVAVTGGYVVGFTTNDPDECCIAPDPVYEVVDGTFTMFSGGGVCRLCGETIPADLGSSFGHGIGGLATNPFNTVVFFSTTPCTIKLHLG